MAKMEKDVIDLTVDSSAESEVSETNLEDHTTLVDDSLWESSTEGSSDEDFETSSHKCSK